MIHGMLPFDNVFYHISYLYYMIIINIFFDIPKNLILLENEDDSLTINAHTYQSNNVSFTKDKTVKANTQNNQYLVKTVFCTLKS